jgi:hypothetical protein
MEKFGSFSPKKFKLAFRVPNNCALPKHVYIFLPQFFPAKGIPHLVKGYKKKALVYKSTLSYSPRH